MDKKRLDYLDMAKGIGALLVLMGHLQGDPFYSYSPYFQPMCVFIFSFHMPMFFILSGILVAIKNEDEKPFKEVLTKRFKGIMVPYYWFSLFYLIYVLYYLLIAKIVPFSTLLLNIWYVISGYGMNVLWFLPALFLGEMLFIYIRQKLKDEKKIIAVIVGMCAIIFVISYFLTLVNQEVVIYKRLREFATVFIRPPLVCGFIAIGYYARKMCENDDRLRRFFIEPKKDDKGKILPRIRIAYIVLGLCLMAVCLLLMKVNNGIDFRTMAFRNVYYFMLCALSGSFGLIIMCKGLPKSRLLCYIGTGSLIYMATHNLDFILPIAIKSGMIVNKYITRARGYISYLVIVTVITLFCLLMIYLIQNYFPFIIGRKKAGKK